MCSGKKVRIQSYLLYTHTHTHTHTYIYTKRNNKEKKKKPEVFTILPKIAIFNKTSQDKEKRMTHIQKQVSL